MLNRRSRRALALLAAIVLVSLLFTTVPDSNGTLHQVPAEPMETKSDRYLASR